MKVVFVVDMVVVIMLLSIHCSVLTRTRVVVKRDHELHNHDKEAVRPGLNIVIITMAYIRTDSLKKMERSTDGDASVKIQFGPVSSVELVDEFEFRSFLAKEL